MNYHQHHQYHNPETEQGCKLANTENVPFPKFNPIYSQPISQHTILHLSITTPHNHNTYTTPTQYYYE